MTRSAARVLGTAASACWAAFILALLLMPGSAVPRLPVWASELPIDKLVHAFLFFVQAYLLTFTRRAFAAARLPRGSLALICLATVAYGGLTELLQTATVDRTADVADFLFDASGVAVFALGVLAFRKCKGYPSFDR